MDLEGSRVQHAVVEEVDLANVFLICCHLSERLSIAQITNPWAPVEETTGPHRVANKNIGGSGQRARRTRRAQTHPRTRLCTYTCVYEGVHTSNSQTQTCTHTHTHQAT